MQRLIVGLLVFAFVGAGATVWLVSGYIDKRIQATAKRVEATRPSTLVLVARGNIPIGRKILRSDVDWLAWPENGIQKTFISSPRRDSRKEAEIVGSIARRGIIKGTPMTKEAVFKTASPGFLAGVLAPEMRAISLSVTPATSAAGFIMPGDRIDIILMQDVKRNLSDKSGAAEGGFKPYARHTAETILHNLKVLAVDQKVDDFNNKKAKVSRTVTLEVTEKQAEAITVARAMGKLGLTLRSFIDNQPETNRESLPAGGIAIVAQQTTPEAPTVTTDLEVSPVLAASVATAAGPRRPPPVPTYRPRPRSSGSPVKIYRGGRPSTVNF